MVFGLFGKSNNADLIVHNARIWTGDPDLPEARELACKDGRIIALGLEDGELDRFRDKRTEMLDLEDRFVTPGLAEAWGSPVLDAFRQSCLILDPSMDLDDVVKAVGKAIAQNPGEETFFAYGYGTGLLEGLAIEEAAALLDGIASARPVLLLCRDGYRAWMNTPAMTLAREAAEEEGMEILTLPFTLSVLNPFNYEALQQAVVAQAYAFASQGITCVYNGGSPDPFDNIYQNILVAMEQEHILPQRHYGSLSLLGGVNTDFVGHKLVQNRNKCVELDETLNYNTLHIFLDETTRRILGGENLKEYCRAALERGFDVLIQVDGRELLLETFRMLASVKAPAGSKACITVAHDEDLAGDERYAHLSPGDVFEVPAHFAGGNGEACLRTRTLGAAEKLALLDRLGTLEPGKYADFAVFDKDPLQSACPLSASMTFLGGNLVFDRDEDTAEAWNQIIHEQRMEEDEPDFD